MRLPIIALLGSANAFGNVTRRLDALPRPVAVAAVGPAPKAVILFTHLRRCGGSFVEDAVLKPHVAAAKLGKPLLCKEGELARHARLAPAARDRFARDLAAAPLVWRHCPYGVHALAAPARPYVYVTMLRRPFARLASWFAYCDAYSKDKCHTAPYRARGPGSRMLAFYDARRRKYAAVPPAKIEAARNAPVAKLATFHPNWLEYALDDNYATRMLAAGQETKLCSTTSIFARFRHTFFIVRKELSESKRSVQKPAETTSIRPS